MEISVDEAAARLEELVAAAERGEDVVLTHAGRAAVRLLALTDDRPPLSREAKRALLDDIRVQGRKNATPGPDAARSQDFLYDEDGLPA